MPLDEAARAELDGIFLADAHERLERLASLLEALVATPDGDRTAASTDAHSLRGSAAMTRHDDLAALCASIEELLGEDEPEPAELLAAARLLREARDRLRPPPPRERRLRDRFLPRRFLSQLALILALAIVPALGLAAYDAFSGRVDARREIRLEASTDAQLAAAAQAQVLVTGRRVLDALSATSEIRGGDPAACRDLLARYAGRFRPFVGFGVADPDGRIRCASFPLPPGGLTVTRWAVVKRVLATRRFAVGPLVRVPALGQVVRIGQPLGRSGAVIGAAIDLGGLQRLVDGAMLPAGGSITVFDRQGWVLARRPDPARYVGTRADVATIRALNALAGTREAKGIDGVRRLYAYHSAGPWYVSVGIPTAPAYSRLTHELLREWLIVGGLGLLGFLVALLGARASLGRPLRTLVATTRRLGGGDLAARTGMAGRGGELGELASSIDAMAGALERSASDREDALVELASRATELEERVQARTADLEEARAAAERSSQAKSAFMSRLSHELRTPLNGIRGFATLLAQSELGPDDHEAARHVSSAAEHMTRLVDELLDTARIEAGQFRVQLEAVRVGEVVEDVATFARAAAADHEVSLTWSAVDPELRAAADRQRLSQTLINLVTNAIDYNRPGGTVHVSARRGDAGHVVVTVEDTGVGIAAADLDRVFTPYDRLGRGPESSGLGLGLALSQRLVEAMGGSISVASELGAGTTFRVELLDADHDWRAEAPAAGGAAANGGQKRVLYVDDDPTSRRLVELILGKRGVELVEATSAKAGLEAARAGSPDLILLDLRLPDGSGLDVLKAMRGEEALRAVPIVVLSGDGQRETVRRLLEAGADDFLLKPLELDLAHELFDRLHLGSRAG